ncbi:MAG: hypothetical protein GEV07_06955 [Streptosporangiales bacterium]|nr:hypothetical protein [Streptosporangiales bacterium]
MTNGKAVAVGVAVGYLLGRTKKMKLGLMLGAVAVGRTGNLKTLVQQGSELVQKAPGLQTLFDDVRVRLADTTAAAGAVASRGVDRLSDNLEHRAEQLRGDSSPPADEEEPADEDEPVDETDETGEQPAQRSTSQRQRSGGGRGRTAKKASSRSPAGRQRRASS